jgi:hypothetical protein
LRGLGAEATFFKRMERAFMYNWQCTLKDVKGCIKLSAKSESNVLKFDAMDWLEWSPGFTKSGRSRLLEPSIHRLLPKSR